MQIITQQENAVKGREDGSPTNTSPSDYLTGGDRHLLFRSTLGLFLRRANRRIPVTANDLIRLLPYVDPDPEEQGKIVSHTPRTATDIQPANTRT